MSIRKQSRKKLKNDEEEIVQDGAGLLKGIANYLKLRVPSGKTRAEKEQAKKFKKDQEILTNPKSSPIERSIAKISIKSQINIKAANDITQKRRQKKREEHEAKRRALSNVRNTLEKQIDASRAKLKKQMDEYASAGDQKRKEFMAALDEKPQDLPKINSLSKEGDEITDLFLSTNYFNDKLQDVLNELMDDIRAMAFGEGMNIDQLTEYSNEQQPLFSTINSFVTSNREEKKRIHTEYMKQEDEKMKPEMDKLFQELGIDPNFGNKTQLGGKTRKTKKVRKHRGIIQTGGNKGKLKKGYKYTGKRLKNGLSEIKKVKAKK